MVRDSLSGRRLMRAKVRGGITVSQASEGLRFGNRRIKSSAIEVIPTRGALLEIDGRRYRGILRVLRKKNRLWGINLIGVEEYLRSVVPAEMISSWDMEALKAQAIVSRSMARFHMNHNRKRDWDIRATTQVYPGMSKETARTDTAVRRTRGKILYYRGKTFLSYFHTACGGHTEYAANVWEPESRFPRAVKCPYCKGSKPYRWEAKITVSRLEEALGVTGIWSIRPSMKSKAGGRITEVGIRHSGSVKKMKINEFRRRLGYNTIRSGFFTVSFRGSVCRFSGRGWGHGVGLCQWGAKKLADRGYSTKKILRYYFPGSRVK